MRFNELSRVPVSVTGRWGSIRYTTRLRGFEEEYFVWSHVVRFSAEVPIRGIVFVAQDDLVTWGRQGTAKATRELEVFARFFPLAWTETDEVDIQFGRGGRLVSQEVKEDARKAVALTYPEQASTGEMTDLASVPGEPPADLRILLLDHSDTEDTRLSKWRMTKRLRATMPDDLNFLTTGYQSGSLSAALLT